MKAALWTRMAEMKVERRERKGTDRRIEGFILEECRNVILRIIPSQDVSTICSKVGVVHFA